MTQHYPFFTISGANAHAQRLPLRLRSNADGSWNPPGCFVGIPVEVTAMVMRCQSIPESRGIRKFPSAKVVEGWPTILELDRSLYAAPLGWIYLLLTHGDSVWILDL